MAEEKLPTPEKELLKLIEKPWKQGSLHATAIKRPRLGFFSFGALKARFSFFKNRIRHLPAKGLSLKQLNVKAINWLLIVVISLTGLYFVSDLSSGLMDMSKPINVNLQVEGQAEVKAAGIPSLLRAASFYLEKARERDIFKMGPKKEGEEKGPSDKIVEATQNLKLVGISWSDDPDIMIEDTKNKVTFFLKKGQMIKNTIKLEAVFKDRVVLSYAGEEIILK